MSSTISCGCSAHGVVWLRWAVRLAALTESRRELDLAGVFRASRDHGLEPPHVSQIARQWAPVVRVSEPEIEAYLTRHIHYCLDRECREGLELFYRCAAELDIIAEAPELRMIGTLAVDSAFR